MNSELFLINLRDLAKGAFLAGLVVLLGAVQQAVNTHGFDFATYDWATILDVAIKAGSAYLIKNVMSDKEGKVLGKIG